MLARALGILAPFAALALACTSYQPASSPQTTSAQRYAAGSPDLRTVDNAGYVDPAGRTGQVSQGGATAVGRGTAVAPPHRESPTESGPTQSAGEGSAPAAPQPSASADPVELTERAARALCDRETYCDRIGAGKSFESADACLAAKRERVHRAVSEGACREIRGERVAQCLGAIRAAECGPAGVPVQPPPACTADVLCK